MSNPHSGIRPDILCGAWWFTGWAAAGFCSGLMLGLWLEGW
jgi:hypothetical protein